MVWHRSPCLDSHAQSIPSGIPHSRALSYGNYYAYKTRHMKQEMAAAADVAATYAAATQLQHCPSSAVAEWQ